MLTKSNFIDNSRVPLLEKALQAAIADARAVAARSGRNSQEAQATWDAVNELEADLACGIGQAPAKPAAETFGEIPAVMPALL
ncbi:MAG: CP12 domain-containing protein [Cyanobacteria bacterium J06638_20]